MELNADFTRRVLVHSGEIDWLASPMPGVDRRMLDRIGDEVARATSIVRYAKGSHFSQHTHTGGEEFIVLEGVFQDEHGDYPAGTYVRNPPGSKHTPGAAEGCVIFVKLWQFAPDDRNHVTIDMTQAVTRPVDGRSGVSALELFEDTRETVRMEQWEPDARIHLDLPEGGEFLVLDGGCDTGQDSLVQGSWLRMPEASHLDAIAGPEGARIWMKLHHIPHAQAPAV